MLITDYSQVTTVSPDSLQSIKFPVKAIILNDGDHSYVKVRFDDVTKKTIFEKPISSFTDSNTRAIIWHNLFHQALDFKVTSVEYF